MPLPRSAAFLALPEHHSPALEQLVASVAGVDDGPPQAEFEAALVRGLRRAEGKAIPSSWLYDDIGSVLFEAITRLPEYGLTRADDRVIARCLPHLSAMMGEQPFVAELGSGSGRKTRAILQALGGELSRNAPIAYAPIDVSATALEACVRDMQSLEGVALHPTVGGYLEGLSMALGKRRPEQRALVLFLGSTIGNFLRHEIPGFLGSLRSRLRVDDLLLLGADLEKPASVLELAYDDPAGVTAAFNRNLLGHINRSFSGDFDLSLFQHRAIYNRDERRIEMYLEAVEPQLVCLEALDLRVSLRKGECILTEYSHKFHLGEIRKLAESAGFEVLEQWVDREWPFAETLLRAL